MDVSKSITNGIQVALALGLSLSRMVKVIGVTGQVAPLSFCAKGMLPPVTVTFMLDCAVSLALSVMAYGRAAIPVKLAIGVKFTVPSPFECQVPSCVVWLACIPTVAVSRSSVARSKVWPALATSLSVTLSLIAVLIGIVPTSGLATG